MSEPTEDDQALEIGASSRSEGRECSGAKKSRKPSKQTTKRTCANRHCGKTAGYREKPRSIYCSRGCQTREQNIRQHRARDLPRIQPATDTIIAWKFETDNDDKGRWLSEESPIESHQQSSILPIGGLQKRMFPYSLPAYTMPPQPHSLPIPARIPMIPVVQPPSYTPSSLDTYERLTNPSNTTKMPGNTSSTHDIVEEAGASAANTVLSEGKQADEIEALMSDETTRVRRRDQEREETK